MTKEFRPDGWKPPEYLLVRELNYWEQGASAMLQALRKGAFLHSWLPVTAAESSYHEKVSLPKEKGVYVFIPDDTEEKKEIAKHDSPLEYHDLTKDTVLQSTFNTQKHDKWAAFWGYSFVGFYGQFVHHPLSQVTESGYFCPVCGAKVEGKQQYGVKDIKGDWGECWASNNRGISY